MDATTWLPAFIVVPPQNNAGLPIVSLKDKAIEPRPENDEKRHSIMAGYSVSFVYSGWGTGTIRLYWDDELVGQQGIRYTEGLLREDQQEAITMLIREHRAKNLRAA